MDNTNFNSIAFLIQTSPLLTYRTCIRCVLDEYVQGIDFNDDGLCSYCRQYDQRKSAVLMGYVGRESLDDFVSRIKIEGRGKDYDCLVGISGGTDSSYLLYEVIRRGLRPLAVHFDCGWNSETAVRNIETLIRKLDVDLYTYVVDWEEFRDVQLAYLKAGVIDLEIPTDHSFVAALYQTAAAFGISCILTGHNYVTEGLMPQAWIHNKGDAWNLKDIHRRFGTLKTLKSFPILTLRKKFYYYNMLGIRNIFLLNHLDYNKEKAVQTLYDEFGWKAHPVKHGESVWTRFYQCYILPRRFGVDKRQAHLSNLICSGQITRDQALQELEKPVYDPELFESDKLFVQKKFRITGEEMEEYLRMPIRRHTDFLTDTLVKGNYNAIRTRFNQVQDYFHISNRW